MSQPVYLVTASDARYFELFRGAIESVVDVLAHENTHLCVLDLGLTLPQRRWVDSIARLVVSPDWPLDFPGRDAAASWLKGLLVRPFLRDLFPGAEVYFWFDADTMMLDRRGFDLFILGARRRGLAIVPEIDRGSGNQYGNLPLIWKETERWYTDAFGQETARILRGFPMLNAGVFAMHRDAPHWESWQQALTHAAARGINMVTDQLALNYAVYLCRNFDRTDLLPAWCNWVCNMCLPAWDIANDRFTETCLPHVPISILHLTGAAKGEFALAAGVAGGFVPVRMRYPPTYCTPKLPNGPLLPGDYVSPGMATVMPDACFPTITSGLPGIFTQNTQVPATAHRCYVDQAAPTRKLPNRDEAAIIYNTAQRFRGSRALIVGDSRGWSAFHLALAGVSLDVVDSALSDEYARSTMDAALTDAGVRGLANLVAAQGPNTINDLARGRKWSLFLWHGAGPEHHCDPLQQLQRCAQHAESNALMIVVGLDESAHAETLTWLQRHGWKVCVYRTARFLGVA
ncbi:MAG: hypothetical protein R3E01_22315 [Pirellulaceae bacterium]